MVMFFEILLKILTINLIFIYSTVAVEKDDEACRILKKEFEEICFSSTNTAALIETETFCSAFKQTCAHIVDVKTLLSRTVQNKRYCKKYRDVFQFVCPEPTRFGKYSNDAMNFCPRYQTRCPNEPLPSQPMEPQKKKHIYFREINFICEDYEETTKLYCTNPVTLKVKKIKILCFIYKTLCIDTLTKVIYQGKTSPNYG
ncbi:Hypothetical protein SRAE_X000117300 [Strongyloides ratti]|uniref:DUF19 domain-containing protein n=1 Tax=Strongyloides ratti TaxID=34506 RepID=A0A090KU83_STRRB|nr:Hypothetical protein SRAE_X000117300 [Strongyloides ratti]CEF59425.1 Hypothetical protein SRAE_X000117300 [Strongyloides ratti]